MTPPKEEPIETGNQLMVYPPYNGYERYAVSNELTPLEEIINLPTDMTLIDRKNIAYSSEITGMTLAEHRAYTEELFEQYKRHITVSSIFSVNESSFSRESFFEGNKIYFNNSVEQMKQAFYYAYSTGSIYKGKGIVIMCNFGDPKGAGFTVARNDKYDF